MKLFALFSDPEEVEKARDAIETEGYGDAVVRVVTGTASDASAEGAGAPPVVAGGTQSTGMVATGRAGQTAPQGVAATLGDLSLDPDAREYVAEQMADGAQLMVLEPSGDQEEGLRALLARHDARVMTS